MKKFIVGLLIGGVLFARTGRITGRVVNGTNGSPLRFALVIAENLDNPVRTRITYTGRNGVYVFRHLVPGNYFVIASKPGFRPIYYNNDTLRPEADTVVVTPGGTVDSVDFVLFPWNYYYPGAVVSGRITDEAGHPIPNAFVFLKPVDTTRRRPGRLFSFSDTLGNYTINGAPAGSYLAIAYKPGFYREFYNNASTPDSADTITLSENDTLTDIDFTLTRVGLGAIAGTVRDENTLPLEGARVLAVKLVHGRPVGWRKSGMTDSSGNYVIGKLIPGNYIVLAGKFGYHVEFYQNASVIDSATPVRVTSNDTVGEINFSLEPWGQLPYDTASISGTVTDEETGSPIANAKITAFFRRFPHTVWTRTDSLGHYTLRYLPAGDSVIVLAMARGYVHEFYREATHCRDATPVIPPADMIDFTLAPRGNYGSGGIMGSVSSGKSSTGYLVTAKNTSTSEVFVSGVDEAGSYLLGDLPPGSYEVSLYSLGGLVAADTVYVSDEYVEKDFRVTEVEENTCVRNFIEVTMLGRGKVKIGFSVPVAGNVEVRLYDVTGRVVKVERLGRKAAGRYTIDFKLRSGIYFVEVRSGGVIGTGRFVVVR